MHTTTARSLSDVLPRTAQPGADGRLTPAILDRDRAPEICEMSYLLARDVL